VNSPIPKYSDQKEELAILKKLQALEDYVASQTMMIKYILEGMRELKTNNNEDLEF
jgi:hypothetical protein